MQPYIDAIRKENGLFRTLVHPNIMRYYDIEISEVQGQNQFTGLTFFQIEIQSK